MAQLQPGEGDGRRSRGRLAFAQLVPEAGSLFSAVENLQLLEQAIKAGTRAERHGREWRMGQRSTSGSYLLGRLGFVNAAAPTEIWNEGEKDFVEAAYPNGYTSPFAVRVTDLVVAFQLRAGQIKRQSFAGALQALMREASGDAWRVAPLMKPITFHAWRASVSRVTTMTLKLKPPNPTYKRRPLIQELIEGTGADLATAILRAKEAELEGLDTDAEFIRQAVEHAEMGYGTLSAVGERGDDEGQIVCVRFDGEGESDIVQVAADPETGEVGHETLTRELAERQVESERESEAKGN